MNEQLSTSQQLKEDLDYEKQARVYYQNIVYEVCSILDDLDGSRVSYGEGIVCGTVSNPTTEVQDRLKHLVRQYRLRKSVQMLENSLHPAERDVIAERDKQRLKWSEEHDDEHDNGQLAHVAGRLAMRYAKGDNYHAYDWGIEDRHPDPRERLVIAAALLIAEIERIDRLEEQPKCPKKPPREILGKEFVWEDGRKVRVAASIHYADGKWYVHLSPGPNELSKSSWINFCEVVGAEAINQAVAASATTTKSERNPQTG